MVFWKITISTDHLFYSEFKGFVDYHEALKTARFFASLGWDFIIERYYDAKLKNEIINSF